MIYSGRLFSKWKGDFFSTALRDPHISRLVIKRSKKGVNPRVFKEESLLDGFRGRIAISERTQGQEKFTFPLIQGIFIVSKGPFKEYAS